MDRTPGRNVAGGRQEFKGGLADHTAGAHIDGDGGAAQGVTGTGFVRVGWAKSPAAADDMRNGLARLCPRGQATRPDSVGKGARRPVSITLLCAMRLCSPYKGHYGARTSLRTISRTSSRLRYLT